MRLRVSKHLHTTKAALFSSNDSFSPGTVNDLFNTIEAVRNQSDPSLTEIVMIAYLNISHSGYACSDLLRLTIVEKHMSGIRSVFKANLCHIVEINEVSAGPKIEQSRGVHMGRFHIHPCREALASAYSRDKIRMTILTLSAWPTWRMARSCYPRSVYSQPGLHVSRCKSSDPLHFACL